MAVLTVQSAAPAPGVNYTLAAAATSDTFTNDGQTLLLFVNGNAAARTLTLVANPTSKSGYGTITVPNTVLTVPGSATNGGRYAVGFFPQARYNDVGGRVVYTLDDATGMTVAAVRVAAQ